MSGEREGTGGGSTGTVILCGIGYRWTFIDGQVIFDETHCMWGHSTSFAFEKPRDINNTPGIWWLAHLESTSERIPAGHIAAAYEFCCETWGKNFEDSINTPTTEDAP